MLLPRRPLLLLPALLLARPALARANTDVNHRAGVALRGFDTVAWFSERRPRRGIAVNRAMWGGVAWHFASAETLSRFQEQPEAFAPAFGGFCAFGVSRGYKVDIDPEAWHIRADRLYLNYDRGVQRQWLRDMPGYIAAADANWPRLMAS